MIHYGNYMYSVYPKSGKVYFKVKYKDEFRKMVVSLDQLPRILNELSSMNATESNGGIIRFRCYSKKLKKTVVFSRWLTNCAKGLEVDHFPLHNPSINTNENLRCVAPWVNQRNRRNNAPIQADHFGIYFKNDSWTVCVKNVENKFQQVTRFPLEELEQAKNTQRKAQLGFNYDGLYNEVAAMGLSPEAREALERLVNTAGVYKIV
jgi:hypothetical protein